MAEPLVLALIGPLGPGGVLPEGNGLPMLVRIIPGRGLANGPGNVALSVHAAEFGLGLAVVLLAATRWRTSRSPSP